MYSSTLSLTSALDVVVVQHHAPAALTPGKTRHSLYRRLGGPQGRSGRVRKISPPPEFDPRIVQPVTSHYTNWAITAHDSIVKYKINKYIYIYISQITDCLFHEHISVTSVAFMPLAIYWPISVTNSRIIIRWTGHVECTAKSANSYGVLVGRRKKSKPLGSPPHRRQYNIKRVVVSGIRLHDVNWMHHAHVVCCR